MDKSVSGVGLSLRLNNAGRPGIGDAYYNTGLYRNAMQLKTFNTEEGKNQTIDDSVLLSKKSCVIGEKRPTAS